MVSDTAMISEKLVDDGLAEDMNGKLTPVEKATDAAVRALLEEKLYFYQVRWIPFGCHISTFSFLHIRKGITVRPYAGEVMPLPDLRTLGTQLLHYARQGSLRPSLPT